MTTTPPTSRSGRIWLLSAAVGLGLGVFSTLADGILTARLIVTLGNIAAPWALAAFLVGLRARSPRQGALAGGVALAVGIATYYGLAAMRGSEIGSLTLIWTAVAAATGPIMGLCGAVAAGHRTRPSVAAVAAPSAVLLAEAIFFMLDRRVWRYNLPAEPYRLIDLLIVGALVVGALLLPRVFVEAGRKRRATVLLAVAAGVAGSFGLVLLRTLIVHA